MNLTEEEAKRLEKVKEQISMEKEYMKSFEYPLLFDKKSNYFGFINIIPISIILIIIVVIVIIML